jgi:hypothetical protein
LQDQLQDFLTSTRPAPPDDADAARVGLGPDVPASIGGAFMPVAIQPYDEAVIRERLYGIADLYYCYQHERLGVFRAVHKLQELFKAGKLRLSDGPGADRLYRFDMKSALRYTYQERMQAYRRVFGYTDAAPPRGAKSNDAFHRLFSQFNAQVAQLFRDKRVAEVMRGNGSGLDPSFGSIAIVRRAGLDLRANLKQASFGNAMVLKGELLQLLRSAFEILAADDVRRQFGSDSAWDTLEEVLQRYLGESIVVSQRSRMGVAGRAILQWLAGSFILATNQVEFETNVQAIGVYAEEWLTSAASLGQPQKVQVRQPTDNVVPLRPRMRTAV